MRVVGAVSGLLWLGFVAAACSSSDPTGVEIETVHSTSEAITAACNIFTVGFPCDPDGPVGPLLECEGVCSLGTTGVVQCSTIQDVGLKNLDGRACGNADGIGDAACARHCIGRGCVVANAAAGAACRPDTSSTPCDGQCNGAGACTPIADPCFYGRRAQLCQFDTCNFVKATTCTLQSLAEFTLCSDDIACRIGTCDLAGSCIPGDEKGCDDGNPCTDDACDPDTGGCIGTPNDNNPCSDNDVCTLNDHCSNGECKIDGHLNCDDGDACVNDACDYRYGCLHSKHCGDGNYCTQDICDPITAACSYMPFDCSDSDPCTIDTCDRPGFKCDHVFTASETCVAPPSGGSGGTGGSDATSGTGGVAAGGAAGAGVGGTSTGDPGGTSSAASAGTLGAASGKGGSDTAGRGGSSGSAPDAGASKDSGGCGCRTAREDSTPRTALWAVAAFALAALRRRRQR